MADFESAQAELLALGVSTCAVSTDDRTHALKMAEEQGLSYPVLYGVDGKALAAAWGSYFEERRQILQATAFVLHPNGKILSATYSTGPIGRITADDVKRFVRFHQQQSAARAG